MHPGSAPEVLVAPHSDVSHDGDMFEDMPCSPSSCSEDLLIFEVMDTGERMLEGGRLRKSGMHSWTQVARSIISVYHVLPRCIILVSWQLQCPCGHWLAWLRDLLVDL
jgi:hypothetical protein